MTAVLDSRWEWIDVTACGGEPEYMKGACRHLEVVPVETVLDGETVAHLCLTCDAQLPAEWRGSVATDPGRVETMSEQARVRVMLTVGDQAEIVADAPDAADPVRYPSAEIAEALGVSEKELPGMRLVADVGPGDRLTGWRRP